MSETINIYCDEGCHLEHDNEKIMLVSCTYCPKDKVREISEKIRELKQKHKIWRFAEIKWTKVSKSKAEFYMELLEYFLNEPILRFRTIIIPDKSKLNHENFGQNHNIWYYKMIYHLVEYIINKDRQLSYNIYTDKKENSCQAKEALITTKKCLKLHYNKEFVLQNIVSHQSEIMQLNDFLQGAISFYNRDLHEKEKSNETKKIIVNLLQEKLCINLKKKNYNEKFNILEWEGIN